jgi:Mn2+/Fe2+ NRAMP family transporter
MSQQRQIAQSGHRAEAQDVVEVAIAESHEVTRGALGIRQQREADWRPLLKRLLVFVAVLGPGQIVMMADTEVGSIITAAQSGARWGYALLPLQFLLIPILFIVQELTVRLGIFTGKGHGELIRERYGVTWGWISIGGLAVSIIGAMVAEFSGIAGVGELLGAPRAASLSLAVGFLLLVVWAGSYRRVERIALGLGLFEPLVLGFLVLLAARALPEHHSLRGFYLWVVAATCAITSGVGVYCALSGMRW